MNRPHYPIVTLAGRREFRRLSDDVHVAETTYGAGKDTVADHMVAAYGFKKIQFAEPLKRAAEAVGIPPHLLIEPGGREEVVTIGDVTLTVRQHLSHISRRLKELYGERVFLNQTVEQCAQREQPIVISDIRYQHEFDWLRSVGGVLLRVWRVDLVPADWTPPSRSDDDTGDTEEAEQSLSWSVDRMFVNMGTPGDPDWEQGLTRTLRSVGALK